ncbi:hypothetical protein FVE85_2465 [Porphyridium purpureum]|uniref:Uncharacterized protein n=1 Tax=Porphyridium purpureum TaxID=35688 RepID=A0A5J4YKL8_PORPP|nr:hypothetical protein FVE85_2465 [Porphyridium purpureum]|eukprot:POR6131..scf291_13
MKRAAALGALVGAVVLGMLATCQAYDITFVDLPCTVDSCQGTEHSVEELQASFSEMVDSFISKGVLSDLKASALSELLYSSLQSAQDSGMKCVADQAFTRAVNLVKALAPPTLEEPTGASRLQGYAKRAVHAVMGTKPVSHMTYSECLLYLGGFDNTCDVLSCSFYRNSPQLWTQYVTCCDAYWGSWSDLMCF